MSRTATTDPQALPGARRCPHCGMVNEGRGSLCRFCFHNLRDAQAAPPVRPTSRLLLILRALGALAIVAVVAVPLYLRFFRGPAPLPRPSSTARSVATVDLTRTRAIDVAPDLDAPLAWRQPLPAPLAAPLVSDGARVYVPLADARLLALSAEDGHTVWSLSVPGQLDRGPVAAGDLLYLGLRDGHVIAIEPATGHVRWSQNLGDWVREAPIVLDGTAYAISGQRLVALDAENGAILWTRTVQSDVIASPAMTDHGIAVVTSRRLFIYDRATGEQTYWLTVPDLRGVAFAQGAVFGLSAQMIVAVEQDSHRPWWESLRTIWFNLDLMGLAPGIPSPPNRWVFRNTPDPPLQVGLRPLWPEPQPMTFDAERVYVSWARGTLRAHDVATGEIVWARNIAPMAAPPMITHDGLLVLERDALVLLEPRTGGERVRRAFPGLSFTDVVVTKDAIVLATRDDLRLLRR